jgi:hypothetical protein
LEASGDIGIKAVRDTHRYNSAPMWVEPPVDEAWKEIRQFIGAQLACPRHKDKDLVFCHAYGSRLDPYVVSVAFERLVRQSGLPRIRFRDLRHTHATLGLAAHVHPKVMSERLGHSSITITLDPYSHAIPALGLMPRIGSPPSWTACEPLEKPSWSHSGHIRVCDKEKGRRSGALLYSES